MTTQNEHFIELGDALVDLDRESRCGFSEESRTDEIIMLKKEL